MRTFYDSLNVSAIPRKAKGILAYNDLDDANYAAAKKRFPKAVIATVTRVGEQVSVADVVDIEPGIVWPIEKGVAWLKHRIDLGFKPTAYVGLSNWDELKRQVEAAGLKDQMGDRYFVAAYPGNGPHLYEGSIGHQWQGHPGNSGGDYDVSVVADFWEGVDTPHRTALRPWTYNGAKKLVRRLKGRKEAPNDLGVAVLSDALKEIQRVLGLPR